MATDSPAPTTGAPPPTATDGKPSDPTFRSYTTSQAQHYASQRLSYPREIYDAVLTHHAATGGGSGLLLDVGCGPGNATRDVAASFDAAIGLDPGEAMIAAARGLGGKTRSGEEVRWVRGAAEELPGVGDGEVDLVIAAMAAHWFDMDKFWAQAARVLKPGGTVAIWTCSSAFCHPSTPNYAKVMAVLLDLERVVLAPYELPPNRHSREMYDHLPLPWDVTPSVPALPRARFVRREWDRDGTPTGDEFLGGGRVTPVAAFLQMLATASMVTRWREAHPELVGTEEDVIAAFGRRLRAALGEGVEEIRMGAGTVVLMFKKEGE